MKKLCIIILLLLSFISNAQEVKYVMLKAETSIPPLVCSNEDRTKWFMIMPHFKQYNGVSEKTYLSVVKFNIGKCSKRDLLIFTFTDSKYMTLRSTIELNCDGIIEITFPLNPVQAGVLEMKSIKSIRYTNGNDQSYFFYKATDTDKDYFVGLLKTKKAN
jgi:hypothetical protein